MVKKVLGVAHGFRSFDNYRLWVLLHCGVGWQMLGSSCRANQRPLPAFGRVEPQCAIA